MQAVPQFSLVPPGESRELASDIRTLFEELASTLNHEQRAYSGECHPAIDVLETDSSMEILVDASGIPGDALRVVFRGDVLIVAGEKAPAPPASEQTYHLVEREFGRFARVVRVSGAFDINRARAILRHGELRIVLPKLEERRGRVQRIAVTSGGDARS
jgi:HSP20 family protein